MTKMQQTFDGTECVFKTCVDKSIALLKQEFCLDLEFFLIQFILTNLANSLRIAKLKRRFYQVESDRFTISVVGGSCSPRNVMYLAGKQAVEKVHPFS